jgi:hypothetical protein
MYNLLIVNLMYLTYPGSVALGQDVCLQVVSLPAHITLSMHVLYVYQLAHINAVHRVFHHTHYAL